MGRNEGGGGGKSSSKALNVGQFPSRKELGLEGRNTRTGELIKAQSIAGGYQTVTSWPTTQLPAGVQPQNAIAAMSKARDDVIGLNDEMKYRVERALQAPYTGNEMGLITELRGTSANLEQHTSQAARALNLMMEDTHHGMIGSERYADSKFRYETNSGLAISDATRLQGIIDKLGGDRWEQETHFGAVPWK
jgi:hypothetical protein